MRRRILGLLPLLLAAVPAAAQDARMDPSLRILSRLGAESAAALRAGPGAPPEAPALPGLAALSAGPAGPEVRLLLRLPEGGEARVEALGGRIGVRAGDIVTARLPLSALSALVADAGVLALEGAALLAGGTPPARAPESAFRLTRPLDGLRPSELSLHDAGAGRVHPRVGADFTGAAGAGVIVGIYDSGLDLDHPDFQQDALGRAGSRVLWVWDQTAEEGTAPGAVGGDVFGYGHECAAATLDACPMRDAWGHGTHVAGIAAGDGSATGNGQPPFRFTGVAPGADLIVVKGGDQSFSSDRVVEGVAYIFARAAELGRPAVVNLSLGGTSGPHDGTTLFERALDALVGPGRILVTIAGNVGTNANETPAFVRAPGHAMGSLATGEAREHGLLVPVYTAREGAITDGAVVEVWYAGEDSLDVVVRTPSGLELRAASGDTASARFEEGAVLVDNAFGGPQVGNGDRVATIVVYDEDAARPPVPGAWTVRVEGGAVRSAGGYHVWLVGSTFAALGAATRLRGGETNSHLITTPGTADRAIAVAAHVTRHEWLDGEGEAQRFPFEEPLGDIAFFSSPGPRRDGVLRPHLSAPGKMVVSAAAPGGGAFRALPWLMEADGRHVALLGTSMAAPHVAGAVALLLERRPELTPEEARDLLTASARADAFTARARTGEPEGLPNAQWGHGKLDVEAALRALGIPAGDVRVTATPLARAQAVRPLVGEQLPLLALDFTVGTEPVAVRGLAFRVTGDDAAAHALVGLDWNEDGRVGGDEPVLARVPLGVGAAGAVTVRPPEVSLAPGRTTRLLVTAVPGGATGHGGRFAAIWEPHELAAEGVLSGTPLDAGAPAAAVPSGPQPTTLLEEGERVALSANPVRGDALVVSYDLVPERAAVYALGGQRVRVLTPDLGPGRLAWDLRDDAGRTVVNGVYFLVLEYLDRRIVEKLFVLRP